MSSENQSANSDTRIIATGLFTPPNTISNDELVESYNQFVEHHNRENAGAIDAGTMEPLHPSSAEFVEKASGIQSRFVMDKEGILDISRMAPHLRERPDDTLSILAEMAVHAARDAMEQAEVSAKDIDGVICACSNLQRAYPAIAVEIQDALQIEGFGFDMNVACASAAFGIETGIGLIRGGARRILVVNPEICTAHLNFRNRDCHFIFGDVATATLLEANDSKPKSESWEILSTRLKTKFSNNIRNNYGFLNHCERPDASTAEDQRNPSTDKLFMQEGRKVFKEVVPMVGAMINEHLEKTGIEPSSLKRLWLHQANLSMNEFIARIVLGRDATSKEAPVVLDEYANTSSAGSIIAFHKHRADLNIGDLGVISGFGAGYSAGSVIVRRIS